eukprot:1151693-Pelagomonas_calceolata.AAC.1
MRGVKQGCPLSPLLFSLYTNDVASIAEDVRGAVTGAESVYVTHVLYADDLTFRFPMRQVHFKPSCAGWTCMQGQNISLSALLSQGSCIPTLKGTIFLNMAESAENASHAMLTSTYRIRLLYLSTHWQIGCMLPCGLQRRMLFQL